MIDKITLKTQIMTQDFQIGFVPNEVYKVEQFGNSFKLIDTKGTKVGTMGVTTGTRKGAFNEGKALQAYINKNGKKTFRKVDMDVYNSLVIPMNTDNGGVQFEDNTDQIGRASCRERV